MTENIQLNLRFDADQVTKALDYSFQTESGDNIYREDGRCAGTFHFPTGGMLDIGLIMTAKSKDEVQFHIIDFTLVSVSTLPLGKSSLSIFSESNACSSVNHWGIAERKEKNDMTTIKVQARERLPIVNSNGQWKISGYLSVMIEKKENKKKTKKMARLFYFDPEATSGTGGDVSV